MPNPPGLISYPFTLDGMRAADDDRQDAAALLAHCVTDESRADYRERLAYADGWVQVISLRLDHERGQRLHLPVFELTAEGLAQAEAALEVCRREKGAAVDTATRRSLTERILAIRPQVEVARLLLAS